MKSTWAPNVLLWRELGVPPMDALAAKQRARLFIKATSNTMHSWIRTLCEQPNHNKKCTWTSGSHRIISRHKIDENALMLLYWNRHESRATVANQFLRYGPFVNTSCWFVGLDGSLKLDLICRARLNALPLGNHLRRVNKIYCDKCPYCQAYVVENVQHLFENCKAWDCLRNKYLNPGPIDYSKVLGGHLDEI